MGRGRAKAKQTKVARDLKYSSPGIDVSRLQRDLQSGGIAREFEPRKTDDDDDPYAAYADDDEETGSHASAAS